MRSTMSLNIEEIEERLGGISLNEHDPEKKSLNLNLKAHVKEEVHNFSDDSVRVTHCVIDENDIQPVSIDSVQKKKAIKNEEPEERHEPKVLLKRGPQRGTRASLHVATPYSNPSDEQCQGTSSYYNLFTSNSNIVNCKEHTGINVLGAKVSFTLHTSESHVPDFSLLLGDVCTGNTSNSTVINLQDKLPLEDEVSETLSFFLNSDDPFPDLGFSDLFPESLDEYNDTPNVLEVSEEPHCSSHSSDDNCLTYTIPEHRCQNLEDQCSPQSSDMGYTSDSTDYTSNANSPSHSLSSTSPTYHLSLQHNLTGSRPTPNPYFKDLDKTYCEKICKTILKTANEKGGLHRKYRYNRSILHLAIEQKNEVYAIVMLNLLQKSFQNGTWNRTLPMFTDLPSFLNQADDFGYTPLLLACINNLPKIVDYLLDCGASPSLNEKFSFGSVLHYICERGSRFHSVAEILCTKASSYVNAENSMKESPLHIAVGFHGRRQQDVNSGIVEIVDNISLIVLLLDKNAKLNVQDIMGRTPLHWIIISKNFAIMNIFCSSTCRWKAAVNMQNIEGKTVLHCAAQFSDISIERQKTIIHNLLTYFASPLIKDNLGRLPKDLVPDDRKEQLRLLDACHSKPQDLNPGSTPR